jgi:peptidoglycan/xylan/chitin deacetylase (PgdA/CDA1 family)
MKKNRKNVVRRFLKHPFVVILPIVALLVVGWQMYNANDKNYISAKDNLMSGGSFESFDNKNVPTGWKIVPHGDMKYSSSQIKGHVKGQAAKITVSDYKNGSLYFESEKIAVQPNKPYIFKGYYYASMGIDILTRYYYKDGSSKLELSREYPYYNDPWSTASTSLITPADVTAMQFIYRITANGDLEVDETYVAQRDTGLTITAAPTPKTPNLVPNPDLTETQNGEPANWFFYFDGDNTPAFTYPEEAGNRFVRANVTNYKGGEAKWQFNPLPVETGQQYLFSVDYRSDVPFEVVVEYENAEGDGRQFNVIDSLLPSGEWTRYNQPFDIPSGVKNVFVSLVLNSNGQLDTDNYAMHDITKPGERRFKEPIVSITYDDAWYSQFDPGAKDLDAHGFKGTFYINPSAIETESFMSPGNLDSLRRRGHQLAAHGNDHVDMSSLNEKAVETQLRKSYEYVSQGLGTKNIDFATPYGKNDAEVQWYIRKFFRSHRGTVSGINTKQNFNVYDLQVLFIGRDTTIDYIKGELAETKSLNGWFILVYHRIEDGADHPTTITKVTHKKQLDAVKQSGIKVMTIDAALKELGY